MSEVKPHERKCCPTCRGDGEVTHTDQTKFKMMTCPQCGGQGWVKKE